MLYYGDKHPHVKRHISFLAGTNNSIFSCASAFLNYKAYVIGGIVNDTRLATVDAYDPATDSWSKVSSMQQARQAMSKI